MLVQSVNIVGASRVKMEEYGVKTWSELSKYIEEHPFEVSIGMISATGVDGMCLAQTVGDMMLMEVPYSSGSDLNSALVGGHCDLSIGGFDEIAALAESGDVIPILALSETRLSVWPEMECTGELGIESYAAPWRAVWAKNGTPQEAIDAFADAIAKAKETDEWKEYLALGAYDMREIPTREEMPEFAHSEYKAMRDYMFEQQMLEKDYEDLK